MDQSENVQVVATREEASSRTQDANAAPVGEAEHPSDAQHVIHAIEQRPKHSNKRKPRSKAASTKHATGATSPPWLLFAAAGVGLAAAAHALITLHRRRSRRAQHERAFAQRFHMEASQPASTLLADARLVVDEG